MTTREMTLGRCLGAAALFGALLMPAAAQRPFAGGPPRGHVSWSGDVDDTVTVSVHGTDVRTQTVSGKDVSNPSIQVVGRLPDRAVRVVLRRVNGRGDVRIVQQPNPRNNFTARVRIHDPQSGSSHYSFVLGWQPRRPGPPNF